LEDADNEGSQGVIRQQILDLEERMNDGNERVKALASEIGLLKHAFRLLRKMIV
jgi:hypothetical protein